MESLELGFFLDESLNTLVNPCREYCGTCLFFFGEDCDYSIATAKEDLVFLVTKVKGVVSESLNLFKLTFAPFLLFDFVVFEVTTTVYSARAELDFYSEVVRLRLLLLVILIVAQAEAVLAAACSTGMKAAPSFGELSFFGEDVLVVSKDGGFVFLAGQLTAQP